MEKPKEEPIWVGRNEGKRESFCFRQVQCEMLVQYIRHAYVHAESCTGLVNGHSGERCVLEIELQDPALFTLDPKPWDWRGPPRSEQGRE